LSLAGAYAAVVGITGIGKWLSGVFNAQLATAGSLKVSLSKLVVGIGAIKLAWEGGEWLGNKLVAEGIGDQWHEWMQNTLGDFYTNAIVDLKTDTFLEQLNASGIYVGLTILAGLKWAFDNTFGRLGDWIWNIVKDTALQIYEAGLEIGNQLVDAIKYVFGGGWLLEMLGISNNRTPSVDTSPGRTSGGREGSMPIIGGGGEGLRFKEDQTKMLSQLEGMYALATFPETGIEINPSPLSTEVQREIREWLSSRERENYEEFKANLFKDTIDLGITGKMTSFELEKEVIYQIAEGIFEPAFMSALAYAESKYKIAAVGGEGYGPFQLEPVAYEQAKKWSDTPMPHTVAATDPVWATEAASNTMKWLFENFESLTISLVAWNRGFGNARTWVEEGSKVEDLPDATKILMTNFMLGLEKELAGDWEKLSESSLEQVRELANIVNTIGEQ